MKGGDALTQVLAVCIYCGQCFKSGTLLEGRYVSHGICNKPECKKKALEDAGLGKDKAYGD
jgi:hypothetical protein